MTAAFFLLVTVVMGIGLVAALTAALLLFALRYADAADDGLSERAERHRIHSITTGE